MAERHSDDPLERMDKFPPTVTGHREYDDGVDLHLLDEGTEEEPRFIRIFDDDRETERYV